MSFEKQYREDYNFYRLIFRLASLEELLDDYRDFLRTRDFSMWDKDSKEAQYVRQLGRKIPQSYNDYRDFVETRPPETVANIAICLIT